MKLPQDTADQDGPNLTPVIDVVFLLLIFFLVATRYDQQERELDIELPEVTQAQPLSMTPELIVNVGRDGKYTIATNEYSETQLAALIAEAKRNNPHQRVLIRGDGEVPLRFAVRVMGFCNQAEMEYQIAAIQEL